MTRPYGAGRDHLAENRWRQDRFNKAASYYYQPVIAKKPSRIRGALRKIFLCAVMALSIFMPTNKMITEILPAGGGTAVTETMQPPAPPIQPRQIEAPYVSQRAGVPASSRGLTSGEIKLARDIFGEKIDLNGMRLHMFNKEQADLRSDVGPGETKNVEFYGRKSISEDFSKASARQFGSFVHEMTYVLQNQQGGKLRASDVEGYAYPLSSQWKFTDYGQQQQRAIVQDYALRFLHPDRQSQTLPRTYGDDRMDTDPFLISLVENQFPAAKAARIAFQNIEKRALTEGERALIKGIFGDQIDDRILVQHFHPQGYSDVAGTANSRRDAHYWGPKYYSKDFSKEKDATRFGVFVHENTHLWQFQTDFRDSPDRPGVYKYPVDPAKWSFNNYTDEQQAAMMEDYATYYLHPSKEMRWLPQVYGGRELQEKTGQMRQIVEARWPGARRVREEYEAKQAASKKPVTISQSQIKPGGLVPAMG